MKEKAYTIYNTPEYDEWLGNEPAKSQVQVRSRIANLQDEGHFGDHKELGDEVCELRWKNGRHVYYAEIPERQIILLLGGKKMVKTRTSAKQRKFSTDTFPQMRRTKMKLKKGTGLRQSNPREELLDEELIGRAIWEYLKNGDSEGVIEVIRIYLEAVNKTQIAKENDMARSTMYHTLKSKNPTVKTLAKLVHACI